MPTTIWKGHLSFGLVSIPVKLYRAARAEKVSFHHLYRAPAPVPREEPEEVALPEEPQPRGRKAAAPPEPRAGVPVKARQQPQSEPEPQFSRIRQAAYVPESDEGVGAPVNRSDLVRGYEYDRGHYVVLSDADLRSIAPENKREMQILEFVRFGEIDPVFLESSYYVVPDTGGEKAYALLFEALRQTGYAALAELAMHRREHVVIIRPGARGLIGHTMFYTNEVRSEEEFRTDTSLVQERELGMAKLLVQSLAAKFEAGKYRDTYRERLEAMIQERVQGRRVAAVAEPVPAREKVVDITEALRRSLEQLKKPVAVERKGAARGRTKRAGGR